MMWREGGEPEGAWTGGWRGVEGAVRGGGDRRKEGAPKAWQLEQEGVWMGEKRAAYKVQVKRAGDGQGGGRTAGKVWDGEWRGREHSNLG